MARELPPLEGLSSCVECGTLVAAYRDYERAIPYPPDRAAVASALGVGAALRQGFDDGGGLHRCPPIADPKKYRAKAFRRWVAHHAARIYGEAGEVPDGK